ncbi:MAG: hypothetical protein L3J96_03835, partial [Thermoplasmata archaeon]|nr:hypothetical protein [Thermoplasmata archaeon]
MIAVLAAVFVTALVLLGGGVGVGSLLSSPVSGAAAPHRATPVAPTQTEALGAAWASISSGSAPVHSNQVGCTSSAACMGPASPPGPPTPSAKTWLNITSLSLITPTARQQFGLAYDAADGYVVLFGGQASNGTVGDTWIFLHGIWHQLNTPDPPAREYQSMVYDAHDGYVLMFGGFVRGNPVNETWKFLAGKWTQLTPTAAPIARGAAAMAYDAKDGYVVLFGGTDGLFTDYGDTWTFQAGVWTKLAKGPATMYPRESVTMGYDNESQSVVLFGGYSQTKGKDLADTWNFTAGNWTVVNASTFPTARMDNVMMYEPALGHLIMAFGQNLNGVPFKDVWQYSLGVWTKLNTTNTPPGRAYSKLVWDGADGYGVLFGGLGLVILNDTWSIGSDLVASVNIIPNSIDVGQSALFRTQAVANNTTYFIYNYFGLPPGCTNSNLSRLTCPASVNGTFPIIV